MESTALGGCVERQKEHCIYFETPSSVVFFKQMSLGG